MVIEKWEAINMLLHKECGKNEVFVGNINVIVQLDTEKDRFEKKGIKYRIGNIVYDIDGKIIKGNVIKPLFIAKKDCEKYDKLQIEELRKIRMG